MDKNSSFIDSFNILPEEDKDKILALLEILTESKNMHHYKMQKNNFNKVWKKSIIIILACLVILFASLFGAFAFSSDFRHAAVEVFEDEGDDYSRVSSASADRGTADAVTFTFINYTAINCKGGRKGMEASFLAKP